MGIHSVSEVTAAGLEEWLRDTLVRKFEVPADALVPGARLKEDLGLESLDFVDLVVEFESLVGRRIETEDLQGLRTVEDVMALLRRLNVQGSPATGAGPGKIA